MKLSVVVVAYNMRREVPRTLQSLKRAYQVTSGHLEYEVLVMDNGSTEKLDSAVVHSFGPEFRYHFIRNAPPSPAYAINQGVHRSTGEIICLMIDGAHLLTPGVFSLGLSAFRAFDNPIVLTRYFYLGPDEQNDSILDGYDKAREDALLRQIEWPEDGYRLFEIGVPFQGDVPQITWFNKMIESNCCFMKRTSFDAIGGAEERFTSPGGGLLNMDIYREVASLPETQSVQLIGEGSFHQLHGGITTNVSPEERDAKVARYKKEYARIRDKPFGFTDKNVFYLGHLPTEHSKIHRRKRTPKSPEADEKWIAAFLAEKQQK